MHGKLDLRVHGELVLNNATDFFLHYFPEARAETEEASRVYFDLFESMQQYYEEIKEEKDTGWFPSDEM